MPFKNADVRDAALKALTRNFTIKPLCGICGEACIDYDLLSDRKANYLNPAYPTIDHKIPTTEGGTDALSNLQVASRQCNSKKNKHKGTTKVKRVPGLIY